jgi:hypothetical protein
MSNIAGFTAKENAFVIPPQFTGVFRTRGHALQKMGHRWLVLVRTEHKCEISFSIIWHHNKLELLADAMGCSPDTSAPQFVGRLPIGTQQFTQQRSRGLEHSKALRLVQESLGARSVLTAAALRRFSRKPENCANVDWNCYKFMICETTECNSY